MQLVSARDAAQRANAAQAQLAAEGRRERARTAEEIREYHTALQAAAALHEQLARQIATTEFAAREERWLTQSHLSALETQAASAMPPRCNGGGILSSSTSGVAGSDGVGAMATNSGVVAEWLASPTIARALAIAEETPEHLNHLVAARVMATPAAHWAGEAGARGVAGRRRAGASGCGGVTHELATPRNLIPNLEGVAGGECPHVRSSSPDVSVSAADATAVLWLADAVKALQSRFNERQRFADDEAETTVEAAAAAFATRVALDQKVREADDTLRAAHDMRRAARVAVLGSCMRCGDAQDAHTTIIRWRRACLVGPTPHHHRAWATNSDNTAGALLLILCALSASSTPRRQVKLWRALRD